MMTQSLALEDENLASRTTLTRKQHYMQPPTPLILSSPFSGQRLLPIGGSPDDCLSMFLDVCLAGKLHHTGCFHIRQEAAVRSGDMG
jgi:hypothetical protein